MIIIIIIIVIIIIDVVYINFIFVMSVSGIMLANLDTHSHLVSPH